ncbi:MAG: glycine zipper family protein [Candidatus Accumulibacter sp.]|uniref:glycine zipper family protein n=1 Tax=Accumulibacter sp. TaxID=2053492 RepID=UPI0028782AD5|nr:glycine zipper family protein [Accumulibacter sp.]MDS4013305.1 glycine zipper family protein [Accumulibacter sp.]
MNRPRRYTPFLLVPLLAACVILPPEGPSVMSLPGRGQSFEQFRNDDAACRNYARQAIGLSSPSAAGVESGIASAAVGTAVGATVGAAVGGSRGAAVGAGFGLLAGSSSGAATSRASAYELQQRYDQNYLQCMYAQGHKVPLVGASALPPRSAVGPRVDRPLLPAPPPPPRGAPPPPPLR